MLYIMVSHFPSGHAVWLMVRCSQISDILCGVRWCSRVHCAVIFPGPHNCLGRRKIPGREVASSPSWVTTRPHLGSVPPVLCGKVGGELVLVLIHTRRHEPNYLTCLCDHFEPPSFQTFPPHISLPGRCNLRS